MKPEEAIQIINGIEEIRGNLPEDGLKVEEALNLAIEALEKLKPMKPLSPEMSIFGKRAIPCGNCGEEIEEIWDYCPWCGQRIKQ